MTAHRLALYLTSRSLLYFRHVIGHMPVDDVDILVPTALLQEGRDGCPAFGELEDMGYRFSAVEQAGGSYGAVGVAGFQDLKQHPALASLAGRHVFLLHASSFIFLPDDAPFTHVLCQFPRQINLGEVPLSDRVQEVYPAGPYQLGEWASLRHLPKKLRLELLQKELGTAVPPDRELILYCGGLHDQPDEQVDAVRQLADTRTVLFKPFYDHPAYEALSDIAGTHLIRNSVQVSPNAMRFAADIILASPLSGVFTTCLLLRQRVIPFFTWHQSFVRDRDAFAPWKARLPLENTLPEVHIARKLGGPYDNKTLPVLKKHLSNLCYWQNYGTAQEALLRSFFGDYRIEGTAMRAARGLLNVARYGVFAPEGQTETA